MKALFSIFQNLRNQFVVKKT